MSRASEIAGLHAANKPMSHLPGGRQSYIDQLRAGRMNWAKLLYPEHNRADAKALKNAGFKVLVRAPGEGTPYSSDVRLMLAEFGGLVDWIECGNEPPEKDEPAMWRHAWHMEYIAADIMTECHRAGIRLCTPGWTGNAEPSERPPDNRRWDQWPADSPHRLPARLIQVYGGWKSPDRLYIDTPGFDAIGFHAYGLHVLEGAQIERIKRWAATFKGMTLLGTEVGIAARDLIGAVPNASRYAPSELIKATRYANFTRRVASIEQVGALIFFLADEPTPEWTDDGRGHGFTIGLSGWERYGKAVAE